jgi:ATP-binding cassette subfamily B protein
MAKDKKSSREGTNRKSGLFGVVGPYKGLVALLIIMALGASGINLIIPRIIARSIDAFEADNFQAGRVVTEFLLAAAGIFIFTFLQGILQTLTGEKVARDVRSKLSDKLSRQSFTFILDSNPAKLLTNLTSDVDSVKMFVSQAFVNIISSLFIIISAAIMLLTINIKLALTVLIIVPIIASTFFFVFRRVRVIFRKSREVIDALNRIINESILGSALIRVLNSQQPECQKFLEKNVESRDLGLSIVRLFSVLVPSIMFISNLAIVIILALGGRFVVLGTLSLGDFAAFNSYIAMLIFPVMMIGFMSNVIASATASYERIEKVLDEPPPKESGSVSSPIKGDIEVKNVSLSYGGKPILKDVSLSVKAASKTAIIGPTAAGKSQLLYLLTNLVPADNGTIEFDGVSLDQYSREVFNRQVGFVFQDNVIFNLTIRENIAFNEMVTEESLRLAVETAELTDFIETLPEKLDTMVSERGTSLSGGQKQRIMLARALAMSPSVLLLDDFTSRVDRKTENRILSNIQKNYPAITLLSVTQKIAPVKSFDQIILLMEGEVVATGKHKDLKESSPEYNQIYSSQRSTSHYEL